MRTNTEPSQKLTASELEIIQLRLHFELNPCDPKCPGWFVSVGMWRIERCDECRELSPSLSDVLYDDIVEQLPEAKAALEEEIDNYDGPRDDPEAWADGFADNH
jgi:predicted metal-dependent phosphoesterase TrpH